MAIYPTNPTPNTVAQPNRYRSIQKPPATKPAIAMESGVQATMPTMQATKPAGSKIVQPTDAVTPNPVTPDQPPTPGDPTPRGGGASTTPVPPVPPVPPTTTPITPVPNQPTGGTPEGPGFTQPIDPGAPTMDENLRGSVFAPGGDERLAGAQGATDLAAKGVLDAAGYQDTLNAGLDRYRSLFGDGKVTADAVDPNVGFDRVQTDVGFNPVATDVTGRQVNTQVQAGPEVKPQGSDRYLSEQDAAVQSIAGSPSRTQAALQALQDFDTAGAEGLQQRYRTVAQKAAQLGRLGMGDTGKEAIDVGRQYEQDRMLARNDLIRSVLEGDINDRYRTLDATSGLRRSESGIESGLRGEARTERDYTTGVGERNVARDMADRDFETALQERNLARQTGERDTGMGLSERNLARQANERDTGMGLSERNVGRQFDNRDFNTGLAERNAGRAFDYTTTAADLAARDTENAAQDRYGRLNAATSLEDQIFGQGASNRAEMRTERGYQQGAAQQSLENRIRERELQDSEKRQQLSRAIALMQAGDGLSLEQALAMLGG